MQYMLNLEKPRLINLERRLAFAQSSGAEPSRNKLPRLSQPLEEIRRLTSKEYGKYRSDVIRFGAELQKQVILSSFTISEKALTAEPSGKASAVKIPTLEKRISRLTEKGFFQQTQDKAFHAKLQQATSSFFAQVRASHSGGQTLELLRIKKLADIFIRYEQQVEGAHARINAFLARVNGFLKDSKKQVFFDEDTNRLYFHYFSEKNVKRDISFLSSGERQILVLFAYIAFLKGALILVDEPEVSLHPRWQENFLSTAKELILPHTQLILATHSPAIVGRNASNVILLEQ